MRCCEDRGRIAQVPVDHGCRKSTYYHHRDRKHEDSGRVEEFSVTNALFYDTHFAFNDEEIRERKLQ